jgi:hypothetical protein
MKKEIPEALKSSYIVPKGMTCTAHWTPYSNRFIWLDLEELLYW